MYNNEISVVNFMFHAILCGFCGASASVVGKLAFSSDNPIIKSLSSFCRMTNSIDHCNYALIFIRAVLFGGMLFLNAAMVANFLRAMEKSPSVIVTVVSTATNYLVTGLFGKFLLSEKLGERWILGSTLICVGLCLIAVSQDGFPKLRLRSK